MSAANTSDNPGLGYPAAPSRTTRSPMPATSIATGLTGAVVLSMGLLVWTMHAKIGQIATEDFRLLRIQQQVMYLDEVLTMSAYMAAATGDLGWKARYDEHVPKLDEALAEAMRLVPDARTALGTAETRDANERLIAIEQEAFDHVARGELEPASKRLHSEEYRRDKLVYSRGMDAVRDTINERLAQTMRHQRHVTVLAGLFTFGGAILVVGTWVYVLRLTRRHYEERDEADRRLHALNESLERRVVERTAELSERQGKLEQEIEERRRLESQLVQAQKLESIGQLAAGIAHEINTPMQYVTDNTRFLQDGFGDLLRVLDLYAEVGESEAGAWEERRAEVEALTEELDVAFLREEVPRAIEQTLEGAGRVTEIVGAMKRFSHPGGDDKSNVDLNGLIRSTVTVCRNRWKYVAELELDLAEDLPVVPCMAGEFNQVVLNLIINAADAIGERFGDEAGSGRIWISTRAVGDGTVEVRIGDNGGGVPASIRDKIFDPFFTTKGVGKGTGQGLAISRDIVVNKHGGSLDLEVAEGVGTTFVIRLPLSIEGVDQPSEAGAEAALS